MSEMVILFGASSGKDLGNEILSRPFSMVALICSSCGTDQSTFIHSKGLINNDIPVHLEEVEGYGKTCHSGARARCNRPCTLY